jgi:predicted Zn-dependent protease
MSNPQSPRLPGLGTPMQKGGAPAGWNYPVNPFELQKQLEVGIEHHKAGRAEDAEKVYRAVLAKVPNQPDALNLLGVLAMEAGNHDAAFDLLERAVAARPKDPVVLTTMATRSRSFVASRKRSQHSSVRSRSSPTWPTPGSISAAR